MLKRHTNVYVKAARAEQALVYATLFSLHRIAYQDVLLMGKEQWAMASKAAGVQPPNSLETVMLIVKMMRSN
jgi:hypothetical protein